MACPCHASVRECTHPPPAAVLGCSHIQAHSDPCWGCPRLLSHCLAQSGWNPQESHSCSAALSVPTPPIPTTLDRSSDPLCSNTPQYSALPPGEPKAHALAFAASAHPERPPPEWRHPPAPHR